jgi:hypothetical protein
LGITGVDAQGVEAAALFTTGKRGARAHSSKPGKLTTAEFDQIWHVDVSATSI